MNQVKSGRALKVWLDILSAMDLLTLAIPVFVVLKLVEWLFGLAVGGLISSAVSSMLLVIVGLTAVCSLLWLFALWRHHSDHQSLASAAAKTES